MPSKAEHRRPPLGRRHRALRWSTLARGQQNYGKGRRRDGRSAVGLLGRIIKRTLRLRSLPSFPRKVVPDGGVCAYVAQIQHIQEESVAQSYYRIRQLADRQNG